MRDRREIHTPRARHSVISGSIPVIGLDNDPVPRIASANQAAGRCGGRYAVTSYMSLRSAEGESARESRSRESLDCLKFRMCGSTYAGI